MLKSKWPYLQAPYLQALCGACATLGSGWSCSNPPDQTLECHVQYADELQTHAVAVASNPYVVQGVPIHGRFEFRAVYLTEPNDLAELNIYVYQTSRQRALIHQLKLQPPYQLNAGRFGITGLNSVYDETARELQYWCDFAAGKGTS